MYCKNCGEENPNEAVFCKNCGTRLKEEVKKAQVIDQPQTYEKPNNTASKDSSDSNPLGWIACCCIGIFIIFLLSAIFSGG